MIRSLAARGPDLSRIRVEFGGEGEEHDELNEERNTNAHHTDTIRFALVGPNHQPNRITRERPKVETLGRDWLNHGGITHRERVAHQ